MSDDSRRSQPTPLTPPPPLTPLQRAFLALEETRAQLADARATANEPIAIIGLGCRLPGADGPQAFWSLLSEGRDAIRPLPADRWDVAALYDADVDKPGHIAALAGGFLDDVRGFDAALFGITRREAERMDPQQRLLLEVAWDSLENAGYPPDRLAHSRTGVYIGVAGNDYATLVTQADDAQLLDGHFASGIAHSVVSGRLSYLLGLEGPSLSIDTACSSSLVALHLACQGLRAGDCRMALAGGVNLILSPDVYVALSRARMLSPDGRCKTFDAAADGFARGEGCGLVVLKGLRDATADGDRVLAVIRGSAVNQDGASSGLTAPSGPAQRAVIRSALARAGVEPRHVGYVEAHGTGTELGDPLELRSLADVFAADRSASSPRLRLGAVKTNIGHVEAAAGVAGLIKVVLSLRHATLPAHLNVRTPTSHIDWLRAPFEVHTQISPWVPIDGRRIAGVSSFGFSGTNAHVVLEEAPPASATTARPAASTLHLLIVSAASERALAALARRLAATARTIADDELPDLCHAAAVSRASLPYRAALLAASREQLVSQLEALADGRDAAGLRTARVTRHDPPRVAFLFTGQGAQYAGMAARLDQQQPVFRAALERCAAVLDAHLDVPLRALLFPAPGAATPIDATAYAQPALFAVEYALAELLRHWGVAPDVVIGHSLGELVAATVAGIMPLDDALRLVVERGRLMQSRPPDGAMAAVYATEQQVAALLGSQAQSLSVAAVNAPAQVVVSGPRSAVQAACSALQAAGIRCEALAVSHAFHSTQMDPILDDFERAASTVRFAPPALRFVSNLTGALAVARDVVQPAYWRRHLREPVRFVDGIRTLRELDAQVCVEIGPHPVLLSFVRETLGAAGDTVSLVPTLRRSRPDDEQTAEMLGSLFLAGVAVDWRAVGFADTRGRVDLPGYPFEREPYWFTAARVPERPAAGRATGHPLLGSRLRSAALELATFEVQIDASRIAWLRDHRVAGRTLLPATAFLEMAFAAGRATSGKVRPLRDVLIAEPLVVAEDEIRTVQVLIRRAPAGDRFEILSLASGDDDAGWRQHARGSFGSETPRSLATDDVGEIRRRCVEQLTADQHHAQLRARGLDFGPSLRGLRAAWRRDGEALGEIDVPADRDDDRSLFPPALLDACLQVVSAALPDSLRASQRAYLPIAIDAVHWYRTPSRPIFSHATVSTPVGSESFAAEVDVFDTEGPLARLEGITFRPAAASSANAVADLYRVTWEPYAEAAGACLPSLDRVAEVAGSLASALLGHPQIADYQRGFEALEHWCAEWSLRTLQRLGWQPVAGSRVTADELARALRIAPRHVGVVGRLLRILAEERWLVAADGAFALATALPVVDPSTATATLLAEHPSSRARIVLTARCGEALPEILRGERDPLDCLFPAGSADLAEALYRDSPEAQLFNQLIRDVVRTLSQGATADDGPRILEVGGGTGGTTAWVAPILSPTARYLFTDVGPSLVARARTSFAAHAGLDFKVFDLERSAAAQSIGDGHDVIIAANVIHATADVADTLARLRALLAPGGYLLMLEVAADERWIDLTFGLTEGWWRFTDCELRNGSPLLDREQWLRALTAAGFDSTVLNPPDARTREALIAARRPLATTRDLAGDWALVGDATGFAITLASRLRAAGVRVHEISAASDFARLPPDLRSIVYLPALDSPPWSEQAIAPRAEQQRAILEPLLRLVQAVGRTGYESSAPQLVVATRGGQAVADLNLAEPAQAPIWGFVKSLALEHPELRPRLFDLDPAATIDASAAALLAALVSVDDAERQVAIRGGRAFVARLTSGVRTLDDEPLRLVAGTTGTFDDLHLVPTPRRAPAAGEVEIRVAAAGVNFRDVMNAVALRSDPEPLGGECAGRIVAVGAGVQRFAPGDHVFGLATASFATHATTSAALVARIPEHIDFAAAATLPFAFMTAHHALAVLARLAPGDSVLIHAGAGGVGTAAIQIAQRAGARVLATAGSDEKRAWLHSLGVEAVFGSRDIGFERQVLEHTHGRGVDVVLNSLAGEFIAASVRCLAPRGRFLEIGKRDIWSEERFRQQRPQAAYHVIDLAAMRNADPVATERLFAEVVARVRAGDWRALPLTRFPLPRASDAFRFMAQARQIGKVVLVRADSAASSMARPVADATYLITGGLTGLGLLTAQSLVDNGARRLVLVGRRAPSEATRVALDALRARGAQVSIVQADIGSPSCIASIRAAIDALGSPLRGIVHAAGALRDGALLQQEWQRFVEPLHAKIDGTSALHELSRDARLDFFVLYSSIASVLGSAGQANHAAANAFLDTIAQRRRADGLAALSISWGVWKDVGAAADRHLNESVQQRGLGLIAPRSGITALEQLSEGSEPHVALFPVRWDVFVGDAAVPPFLARVGRRSGASHDAGGPARPSSATQPAAAAAASIVVDLQSAMPERRHALLSQYIAVNVAHVISAPDPRALDPRQPLNEIGLDSLMSVDLRNRLGTRLGLGRSLPATLVFDHPTIEALARHLLRELQLPEAAPAPATARASVAIDDLSEDEIERLFAQRTRLS